MINIAFVMGRLTLAPELHYTPQGTAYCRLRIATNRYVNQEQRTDFHDVIAWAPLAEPCAKALVTGEVVHVEGRLETSSWEQDGKKQQRTRIVASRIQFLGAGHKKAAGEPISVEVIDGGGEEPS